MYPRGIEDWNRHIRLVQKHADLGASQDHAIGTTFNKAVGNSDIGVAAFVDNDVPTELVIDNTMRFGAVCIIGDERCQTCGNQPVSVKRLFHGKGRGHEARAF